MGIKHWKLWFSWDLMRMIMGFITMGI
jgi:hypothetical protein